MDLCDWCWIKPKMNYYGLQINLDGKFSICWSKRYCVNCQTENIRNFLTAYCMGVVK